MTETESKNTGFAKSNTPPDLFSAGKPRRTSKKRFIVMTILFAIVSSVMLLFPTRITVNGIGQIVPAKIYSVGAEISGKIVEVYCIEGTQVIAGSPIVKLHNEKLSATIEETQKRREIAEGKRGILKAEKETREEWATRCALYYEVGSISLREKRQAEDAAVAIERNIAIQTKEVEEIDTTLRYLQNLQQKEFVNAPAAGVILTPLKDRLEMVLSEGQEVFKLAGKEMAVAFFVPEDQLRFVSVGSKVNIRFVSDPLKTYHGSVLRMDSKVETQQEKVWITKSGVWATISLTETVDLTPGKKVNVQILSNDRRALIQMFADRIMG